MKSRTKKMLIVISTIIFLASMDYQLNYNYSFATKLDMSLQAQRIFWKDISANYRRGKINEAHDLSVHRKGMGLIEWPTYAEFTLDLNDQYKAEYLNYFGTNANDYFIIEVSKKGDIGLPTFDLFVNQRNLQVVSDDSELYPKIWRTPEVQKEIDEMTLEEIQETEELKKLAIQRFKEFQEDYYSKAN